MPSRCSFCAKPGAYTYTVSSNTHYTFLGLVLTLGLGAGAAANSLQSCPSLCDLIDGSQPGFAVHEILQARTLEWVAISFSSA